MREYADLYPYMLAALGACPERVAMQELRAAGRRFFDETEAWEEELPAMNIVADQTDYTLAMPYDCLIKRIVAVGVSDVAVDPDEYDLVGENTLRFATAYTSAATEALVVTLALVPFLETNEVADTQFERWGMRGIRTLALYNCLTLPAPWRDDRRAGEAFAEYRRAKAEAVLNKTRRNKAGILCVTPRAFV